MTDSSAVFFNALEGRIHSYDLLKHPFYQAWSEGELTREDLREYGAEYWHHVSAFPAYLSALHSHLPDGKLRRLVLENLALAVRIGALCASEGFQHPLSLLVGFGFACSFPLRSSFGGFSNSSDLPMAGSRRWQRSTRPSPHTPR